MRRDARGPLTMAEAFEDALTRIDSQMADDPALQGDLLDDFGEILTNRGEYERAQPIFERALATAERVRGPHDPAVAETLQNLAVVADWRGRLAEARPQLERAVAILERHRETEPAALASAYNSYAALLRNDGKLAEATRLTRRALTLLGGPEGKDPVRLIVMHNLANMLIDDGQYDEGEALLRQVTAAFEAGQGTEAMPLIIVLSALEQVVERRGDLAELLRLTRRRQAIAQKQLPPDHPWHTDAQADLGWHLWRSGETADGEAHLRAAIADYDRRGNHDMSAIGARHRLGTLLRRSGRPAEALRVLDVAMMHCRDPRRLKT